MHDAKLTLRRFYERRARLDPVAAIHVMHSIEIANLGMMDVSAYHPIETLLAAVMRDGAFEVTHVAHRTFHALFCPRRERPVPATGTRAQLVVDAIELQQHRVTQVAGEREPAVVARPDVVLV